MPSVDSAYEIRDKEKIGRDPRTMRAADLNKLGHAKTPLLKVIRAKCADCCCGDMLEVRKCTAWRCSLWPYRMNHNPFGCHSGRGNAEALQRARVAKRTATPV